MTQEVLRVFLLGVACLVAPVCLVMLIRGLRKKSAVLPHSGDAFDWVNAGAYLDQARDLISRGEYHQLVMTFASLDHKVIMHPTFKLFAKDHLGQKYFLYITFLEAYQKQYLERHNRR